MQITISGIPGSGKSTIGKLLAKELNYEFYSLGKIRRDLALKRNLSILEYNKLKEDTDSEIDKYQIELGKQKDNIIVDGRLSFHFLPNSIKLFFKVDLEVGAKRILQEQRQTEKSSKKELIQSIKSRIENDKNRYKKIYNIDAFNSKNFDYIIDTTNLTINQVKNSVLEKIQKNL